MSENRVRVIPKVKRRRFGTPVWHKVRREGLVFVRPVIGTDRFSILGDVTREDLADILQALGPKDQDS